MATTVHKTCRYWSQVYCCWWAFVWRESQTQAGRLRLGTVKTPRAIYSIYGDIKGYVLPNIKFTHSRVLYITHTLHIHQQIITGHSWQVSDVALYHFTIGKLFFYQLALSVFITSVSYCVIEAIRDNTTQLLYEDNNRNAYRCTSCSFFLPHGEFHFIVPFWDIIPVAARNNLSPKDALKQTFQLAVLLVTTFLVDVEDWRPVACYSWQDQCTRLMLVQSQCNFRTCKMPVKTQKSSNSLWKTLNTDKKCNCYQHFNVSSLCPFSTISTHIC